MGQRLRPEAALRRRGPQRPGREALGPEHRSGQRGAEPERKAEPSGRGGALPPHLLFISGASSQAAERPMAGSVLERVGGGGCPGECGHGAHAFLGTPVLSVSLSISPWSRWDPGLGSHSGPQRWSARPAPGIFHSSRPPGSVVQPGSSPCMVIAKYLSAQPLPRTVNISGQGCGLFIHGPSAPARGSAQCGLAGWDNGRFRFLKPHLAARIPWRGSWAILPLVKVS